MTSGNKADSDFNNNSVLEEYDGVNIGDIEPKVRVF
jgi:hypothetical protein